MSRVDLKKLLIGGVLGAAVGAALVVVGPRIAAAVPQLGAATDWLQARWHWVFENLRWSIVPFTAVFTLYLVALHQLAGAVRRRADIERVGQAEHWVELWTGTFFGIGVIWTAIGMRSALLAGLGGLDAETAAQQGAFAILRQLVDGGILLALSTTIVGGIGGYLMRVYKNMRVGAMLRRYYAEQAAAGEHAMFSLLRDIDTKLGQWVAGDVPSRPAERTSGDAGIPIAEGERKRA